MSAAVAAAGLGLLCGCSPPPAGVGDGGPDARSKVVVRATMKDDWPLIAEEGLLRCNGSGGVGQVTIEVAGSKYAVNGSAKNDNSNAAIDAIWANDTTPGLKKSISPLIQEGLRLCT